MFKPYEILMSTPEMTIEVTGDEIEIKAADDYITCTPQDVMDSTLPMTFEYMKKKLEAKGESPAEWIKNWYLRAVRES